jgi:hypothetical protein
MTTGRPGVYISERLLPAPIPASSTSAAVGAAIGEFAQGPSAVTYVRSWYDFVKLYGGFNAAYPATFGVGEYFRNGGSGLYVRRVLHSDAAAATALIKDGSAATVSTVTAKELGSDGTNLRVNITTARTVNSIQYFTVLITREGSTNSPTDVTNDIVLEQYLNVRFDNASSSDFIDNVVNNQSLYVSFNTAANAALQAPLAPVSGVTTPLVGTGLDGAAVVAADYTAVFDEFKVVDNPLVMFLPEILNPNALGTGGTTVQTALASWAAANDGFAVIDTPSGEAPQGALTYASTIGSVANAAVYYPNIFIVDPVGRSQNSLRLIGPAGSVAGRYIAADAAAGPFKPPAGLNFGQIGTAVNTERKLTSDDRDLLNSSATPVNAIRNIPGANTVIFGARTLLQDGTANRYVNTRRSLIYIKKQLKNITQFAIFETNDERLWSRLRTTISVFLDGYLNEGGLRGTKPSEAYYIICDASNNTPDSIAQGNVNIEIGVALQYPAEFVQITLTQTTVSS